MAVSFEAGELCKAIHLESMSLCKTKFDCMIE